MNDLPSRGQNAPGADCIGLALSGGGFRATLFHLGVIRCLFENGLLPNVKFITAVSGGSILAAHLGLRWKQYVDSEESFNKIARKLIDFTQLDVRGKIIRRWISGGLWIFPWIFRINRLTHLLEKYYSALYEHSALSDLPNSPDIHLMATSLNSGGSCKFTKSGFRFIDTNQKPLNSPSLKLSLAVAASSAFPPLFPPVPITRKTLNADEQQFPHAHALTDGGVFDNFGLEELRKLANDWESKNPLLIISDAGGNFDWSEGKKYKGIIERNVRASDILMDRTSKLVLSQGGRSCYIDIGYELPTAAEPTALRPEDQRGVRNIRTDLDSFSNTFVLALLDHGNAEARFALRQHGLKLAEPPSPWTPVGERNSPNQKHREILKIDEAKRRRLKLLAANDLASWSICLWIICALFATYYVLRRTVLQVARRETQKQQSPSDQEQLSLLLTKHDPRLYPPAPTTNYPLARVFPTRSQLETADPPLATTLSNTTSTFDLVTTSGEASLSKGLVDTYMGRLQKGVTVRVILFDALEDNRAMCDAYAAAQNSTCPELASKLRARLLVLRDMRIRAREAQSEKLLQIRLFRKALFYSMWIQDGKLPKALAHIEVHEFSSVYDAPSFRVSSSAGDVIKNLSKEFDALWKDAVTPSALR